jgi:hypothetical protein
MSGTFSGCPSEISKFQNPEKSRNPEIRKITKNQRKSMAKPLEGNLRVTPVSSRQAQILQMLIEDFGGSMRAISSNYRKMSDKIGWKNESGSIECLQTLRTKGKVELIEATGGVKTWRAL